MNRTLSMMLALLIGCTKSSDSGTTASDTGSESACMTGTGCILAEELPYGLLSVQAEASDDVWIVGSSPEPADGTGPAVLHFNGTDWERLNTSEWAGAELWWAWIASDEAVFVGNQGVILELDRDRERE